jgi:hypothetical protein
MSLQVAHPGIQEATLEAVIIRADGTRESLGVVARFDKDEKRKAENVNGNSSN